MKIYLCIPYSFNHELSYRVANKVAAGLMEAGHIVFSPISHSHSIGTCIDPVNHTHDFWMEQDLPFVEWADELHAVIIGTFGDELLANSRGCQAEIRLAQQLKKPIKFIEHYE